MDLKASRNTAGKCLLKKFRFQTQEKVQVPGYQCYTSSYWQLRQLCIFGHSNVKKPKQDNCKTNTGNQMRLSVPQRGLFQSEVNNIWDLKDATSANKGAA